MIRKLSWNDPRVVLGCVHLLCVCTVVTTLTTFFSVGHKVREVCEIIKESTLYRSLKVNRDKICLDRLPTISYTGVLLPEQGIFAVGLSLAALGSFRAFDLIARTQINCIERYCDLEKKTSAAILVAAPPLFGVFKGLFSCLWWSSGRSADTKLTLADLCAMTKRVGQISSFWMLPTACVSMKHSIMIHGLSAFFFFSFACVHVCCSYAIQHNLIAHGIVAHDHFDQSSRIKEVVLMCAALLAAVGAAVYLSLRFTEYHLYLYTLGGALGQYTTVVWLMCGFSTYYVDLTVLMNQSESKQQEIEL